MSRFLAMPALVLAASIASAAPQSFDHLEAELVAQHLTVAPGSTTTVALKMRHDPHWHTYWENPGDSGLQTKFRWTLPDGVSASPVLWPTPTHYDISGIHNYGFGDEAWLLTELMIPADAVIGSTLAIEAKASWLICEEECIPGNGSFAIALTVGEVNVADPALGMSFAKARDALPKPAPSDWKSQFAEQDGGFGLRVDGPLAALELAPKLAIFVANSAVVTNAPASVQKADNVVTAYFERNDFYTETPDTLRFLLVDETPGARIGYSLIASRSDTALALLPTNNGATAATGTAVANPEPPLSLPLALLFAMLGGLILNLMPCVFPVLSLKALSIAESGHSAGHSKAHALWYTAGVLLSFAALGLTVLILRSAGEALGWGFQLQSPWFVAGLVYLFVILGLSLSGAITLGAGLTGMGQSLADGEGARSSFFTGVLACVVASPCTAPFMGSALGYAFSQSTLGALAIFLSLGLGLALPFLALAFVPGVASLLPRPGAWMETLKQVLAFPLYLSAVWLLWVLGQQVGIDGAAAAMVGLVTLIFALWWLEKLRYSAVRTRSLQLALVAVVSLLAIAPIAVIARGDFKQSAAAGAIGDVWQPYSDAALAALRAQGTPVFVDMTAAWCATCKVNERIALSSDEFFNAIAAKGVVPMKGDWTDHNAEITNFLQQFGAAGVPLYVVYPQGDGKPEVLPQVLTPSLVMAALDRAVAP